MIFDFPATIATQSPARSDAFGLCIVPSTRSAFYHGASAQWPLLWKVLILFSWCDGFLSWGYRTDVLQEFTFEGIWGLGLGRRREVIFRRLPPSLYQSGRCLQMTRVSTGKLAYSALIHRLKKHTEGLHVYRNERTYMFFLQSIKLIA